MHVHKKYNPPTVAPAYSNYAQSTEVQAVKRWLYVSGQCGVRADGSIPSDFRSQCELAMDNVLANLSAADMSAEDIVKVTLFVVDRADLGEARQVRDAKLGGNPVSSTLVFISGLILPEFKIEIECVAAK
jgi:enamine deaminase RidA (YjgF/YER057c/UK114 family)